MISSINKKLGTRMSILVLICLGSIVWSITMVKGGLCWQQGCLGGFGYWGPNGHDGIWHISLAESLSQGTWEMPVFAGADIKNYHIGFDLILSVIHKVSHIPIQFLYFQIIPPILAILIGYLTYKVVYTFSESYASAWWATFFVYFGGGWGWVITMLKDGTVGGESLFWSQQSISTLVNPPYALSLVCLLCGMFFLLKAYKSSSKKYYYLSTLSFAALAPIKIYGWIIVCGALLFVGFWETIQTRKISMFKVGSGVVLLGMLFVLPVIDFGKPALVWQPGWFLTSMLASTDRLYWPRFAEALFNYQLSGNWIKMFTSYFVAFCIFWIGNLGTRVIKEILVFKWIHSFKKLELVEIFMAIAIVIGVTIPMFYTQNGNPWNTIQFLYYSLFFSGILAGIVWGRFIEQQKKSFQISFSILLVLMTIPTTIGTLQHYLPSRPPAAISGLEMEALLFMKSLPVGTVLIQPFDKTAAGKAVDNPPRPLYLYESTAYVSAFSTQKVYLEEEINLEITGYDYKSRRAEVEQFFSNPNEYMSLLSQKSIEYIYILKDKNDPAKNSMPFQLLYENDTAMIYKVGK
jgi:hypothetical protein